MNNAVQSQQEKIEELLGKFFDFHFDTRNNSAVLSRYFDCSKNQNDNNLALTLSLNLNVPTNREANGVAETARTLLTQAGFDDIRVLGPTQNGPSLFTTTFSGLIPDNEDTVSRLGTLAGPLVKQGVGSDLLTALRQAENALTMHFNRDEVPTALNDALAVAGLTKLPTRDINSVATPNPASKLEGGG